MIRHISAMLLAATVATVVAGTSEERDARLKDLEAKVSSAMTKAGVTFGGNFQSQLTASKVSGDSVISSDRRASENIEYTSVDFDIAARPHEAIGGRVILRMHTDWRNLFSVYGSPIMSRWISIDGGSKDIFTFNVGDFRQKYSPLTLWSPDIEIASEPLIFAQRRQDAMNEAFLGGNERLLQGVNLNLGMQLAKDEKVLVKGLQLNVFGARTRLAAGNRDMRIWTAQDWERSLYDRYVVAGNLDAEVLPQIGIGGTFLSNFDWLSTYEKGNRVQAEMNAMRTFVAAGRMQLGTARFVDPEYLNVRISAEFASSNDDSVTYVKDTVPVVDDTVITHHAIKGTALRAGLDASFRSAEMFGVTVNGTFISTAENFRNEMAQSPVFLKRRIMNSNNDMTNDWQSGQLYSTFDALYRHVFNFAPTQNAAGVSGWSKEPMLKSAWTSGILDQGELASLESLNLLDTVVALVMPFGQATPNRQGVTAMLNADLLKKAIKANVSFGTLSQITVLDSVITRATATLADSLQVTVVNPKTTYLTVGGGLSVDIHKFGILPYTCEIGGGYNLSKADRASVGGWDKASTTVGLLNAGLYWQFWKKAALLGGYQSAVTTVSGLIAADTALNCGYVRTQSNWAAGLQYFVTDAGSLTATFGQVASKTTGDKIALVYDPAQLGFKQNQFDLFLTVKF